MNIFKYLLILLLPTFHAIAHEADDARLKFWQEYYNPKVEANTSNLPTINLELIRNKPFYQLKTNVKNFTFSPENDMKNNNPSQGYGKLFINGEYVSRIYSTYFFIRALPIGNNEIKVILSNNMDHDIANNGVIISDTINYQFPEYTFSEARNKSYNTMIQCEFSDKGQKLVRQLAKKNMLITESSSHLQCRYNARNDILGPFVNKMTRLQKYYHTVTLDALEKRIAVWKKYEEGIIKLSFARKQNQLIEDEIDILMANKLKQLNSAKQ